MDSKYGQGPNKCTCCNRCEQFQKIVELKDAQFVIYRWANQSDRDKQCNNLDLKDVFIVCNNKNTEVNPAEFVMALDQYKVPCQRCTKIIEHAQRLVQEMPTINRREIMGICDHCLRHNQLIYKYCNCKEIAEQFIKGTTNDEEARRKRIEAWFDKIHELLLKNIEGAGTTTKKRAQSEIDFKDLPLDRSLRKKRRSTSIVSFDDLSQDQDIFSTNKFVRWSSQVDLAQKEVKDEARKVTSFLDDSEEHMDVDQKQKHTLVKPQDHDKYAAKEKPEPTEAEKEDSVGRAFSFSFPKDIKDIKIYPKRRVSSSELISNTQDLLKEQEQERKKKKEADLERKREEDAIKKQEKEKRRQKYLEEREKEREKSAKIRETMEKDLSDKKLKSDVTHKSSFERQEKKQKDNELPQDKEKSTKEKSIPLDKEKSTKEKYIPLDKEKTTRERSIPLDKEKSTKEKSIPLDKEKSTKEKSIPLDKEKSTREKTIPLDKEKSTKEKPVPLDKEKSTKEKSIPLDKEKSTKDKSILDDGDIQHKPPKTKSEDTEYSRKSKPEQLTKLNKESEVAEKKATRKTENEEKEPSDNNRQRKEVSSSKQEPKETKNKTPNTEKMADDTLKQLLNSRGKEKAEEDKIKKQQESEKYAVEKKTKAALEKKDTEKIGKKTPKSFEENDNEKETKEDEEKKISKEGKENKKSKEVNTDKLADDTMKQLMGAQAKENAEREKSKKEQDKAREIAEKKVEDKKSKQTKSEGIKQVIPMKEPPVKEDKEPQDKKQPVKEPEPKELSFKQIKVQKSSADDLILKLVTLRNSERVSRAKPTDNIPPISIRHRIKKHKISKWSDWVSESDIELDVNEAHKKINPDIIVGENIIKQQQKHHLLEEVKVPPIIFESSYLVEPLPSFIKLNQNLLVSEDIPVETEPQHLTASRKSAAGTEEVGKGIIRYALSDRSFIEKGWTMLPTEKIVRKMNVYRMRPAHPEFDWFEHNKYKRLIQYDSGERLAEFDDNGRGRWYYRSGKLALDYYDAEEINAHQRFVVYSSGEPDERGKSRPRTVLATFDYLGNGIVFDHKGKIRLKYNQTEGVILDRAIGPVSTWKWHTLNDPPVLQQVMIDTQMPYKDPQILKLGDKTDKKQRPDNEEMLAIEFDNFIKEKSRKLTQKFKPFQIKMKALKINEYFSLRVLDQATVYLIYRDGTTNLKINIGMILDHKEIVDTETAEVGDVSSNIEKLPARTDSIAAIQNSVAHAQRVGRLREERERRLKPPEPSASADQLTAARSRPLRPPLVTASSGEITASSCQCKIRKPPCNLYYDTRL